MREFVAATLIVTALAGGGPVVSERTAGGLRLQFAVNKASFQVGEPVALHLRVSNPSSGPVVITYSTTQQYDVSARQRGALIWQWSHDKAFAQVVREQSLAAGQQLTFTFAWDQRDLQGRQVEPGVYTIVAIFLGAVPGGPRGPEVGPLQIAIGR